MQAYFDNSEKWNCNSIIDKDFLNITYGVAFSLNGTGTDN
jgi:hypothetical protein